MNNLKIGSTVKPDELLSQLFGDILGEVIDVSPSPFSSKQSVTVKWDFGGTIKTTPDSFVLVNQPKTRRRQEYTYSC